MNKKAVELNVCALLATANDLGLELDQLIPEKNHVIKEILDSEDFKEDELHSLIKTALNESLNTYEVHKELEETTDEQWKEGYSYSLDDSEEWNDAYVEEK